MDFSSLPQRRWIYHFLDTLWLILHQSLTFVNAIECSCHNAGLGKTVSAWFFNWLILQDEITNTMLNQGSHWGSMLAQQSSEAFGPTELRLIGGLLRRAHTCGTKALEPVGFNKHGRIFPLLARTRRSFSCCCGRSMSLYISHSDPKAG